MSITRLSTLVDAYEQLEAELHNRRLEVWDELVRVDPKLASEIFDLFVTKDAAAIWATRSQSGDHASPARLVVKGDSADVAAKIKRATHGFSS